MDSNPSDWNVNKKYLIVKIPANVENREKCIQILGGKEKIYSNMMKSEDIELNLFCKNVPLEKCWSNDLILRRKRLRNKKDTQMKKYKYEIAGIVDSSYDFFALHDYICINSESKNFDVNKLEGIIKIKIDFLIGETDFQKLDEEASAKIDGMGEPIHSEINDDTKSVKRILENKIIENSLISENYFQLLQPEKYSYGRNMYPHVFKELQSRIKYKTKNNYI